MQKLSLSVQQQCRSYLSLRELHASRRVSKTWECIENIPVALYVFRHSVHDLDIPSHVHLDNITTFQPSFECSSELIVKILTESRTSLQQYGYFCMDFPPELESNLCFPKMKRLQIGLIHTSMDSVAKHCPNLEELVVLTKHGIQNLDLEDFPSLWKLSFLDEDESLIPKLKNLKHSFLKKLSLPIPRSSEKFQLLSGYLEEKPSLCLCLKDQYLRYYAYEDRVEICGPMDFSTVKKFEHQDIQNIATSVRLVKMLRDCGVQISKNPNYYYRDRNLEMQRRTILYVLGLTSWFSNNELSAML